MTPLLVPMDAVDAIFPRITDYLRRALDRGQPTHLTLPYLWSECSARRAFLFVDDLDDPRNAMVARFEQWGSDHVCHLLIMGGEGKADWNEAMGHIEELSKQVGANLVVFSGRAGWARALDRARPIYTTYAIEV